MPVSEERRIELGYETIFLRPKEGTKDKLRALAEYLDCSAAEALERIVAYALEHKKELPRK